MAVRKVDEWLTDEGLTLITAWARNGLTEDDIATNMGIVRSTLWDWKKKHPNIMNALKKGKEVIDFEVENTLLKKAMGYRYKETTKELIKNPITEEFELRVVREVEKEMSPDTAALIFWLKNRKSDIWRDKIVDTENEEAINNAKDILIKIRKVANERNNN